MPLDAGAGEPSPVAAGLSFESPVVDAIGSSGDRGVLVAWAAVLAAMAVVVAFVWFNRPRATEQ